MNRETREKRKKDNQCLPSDYAGALSDIKQRVRHAQTRAVLAVNAELISRQG